jgi:hypothetical protein
MQYNSRAQRRALLHMRGMAAVLVLLVGGLQASWSQSTEMVRGTKEGETFVAGGHSVPGGRGDSGVFDAGFRFGRVLLSRPSSNLEYSIDLIPVYLITQRQNAFGASFTPFNLKYNLTSFHRVVPSTLLHKPELACTFPSIRARTGIWRWR